MIFRVIKSLWSTHYHSAVALLVIIGIRLWYFLNYLTRRIRRPTLVRSVAASVFE